MDWTNWVYFSHRQGWRPKSSASGDTISVYLGWRGCNQATRVGKCAENINSLTIMVPRPGSRPRKFGSLAARSAIFEWKQENPPGRKTRRSAS